MCLAIPMKIDSILGNTAVCSSRGISRDINIFMFPAGELKAGDYILAHVGYAIQKINADEAQLAIKTNHAMNNIPNGDLSA